MTVSNQEELLTALSQDKSRIFVSLTNDINLQVSDSFWNYLIYLAHKSPRREILWQGNNFKLTFPNTNIYGFFGNKISGEFYDTQFVINGKSNFLFAFEVENLKIEKCKFLGDFQASGESSAIISWLATELKVNSCVFKLNIRGNQVGLLSVIGDNDSQMNDCSMENNVIEGIAKDFLKRI